MSTTWRQQLSSSPVAVPVSSPERRCTSTAARGRPAAGDAYPTGVGHLEVRGRPRTFESGLLPRRRRRDRTLGLRVGVAAGAPGVPGGDEPVAVRRRGTPARAAVDAGVRRLL